MKLLLKLFVILGALLMVSVNAHAQGPSAALTGNWTGSLNVNGTTLHLVCHFTSKPDKSLGGTFDSLDQGATGLPFSTVRVAGQAVHLEAVNFGASFDGSLDAAGKTVTGHWMQGGGSLPLTLTRAGPMASLDRTRAPSAPLTGNWTGGLQAGTNTLRFVVHFTPKPDRTLTATLDSIDEGISGKPFSSATRTGQAIHLEMANIGAIYDGTLDAAAKTIKGFWKQSGNSLPLPLTRTNHVVGLDRPQEPHPPFPYTSTDVTFPGGAAGVMLAGILTTPPAAGPFPVAVLISGTGPNDRDETILGHKPFLLLADTLTRRGIAVLRYDKRGIGKSTGSYALATTADFAADADAAVNFLKTQAVIDPKRIGLIGHSEGGLIAPLIASEHPTSIAFVVLLAGPGMNGEKILLAQAALTGQASGSTGLEIAHNAALQKHLFTLSLSKANSSTVQAEAQAAVLQSVATMDAAQRAKIADPARFAKAQSYAVASPWLRYFLTYDPLPALQKTRCPVLALDGSKDLQVPPAEDLALISQALKAGGNADVTIKEFPNLNHLFQTCTTGSPLEYAKISETMAPVVLTTVSDWIVAHSR